MPRLTPPDPDDEVVPDPPSPPPTHGDIRWSDQWWWPGDVESTPRREHVHNSYWYEVEYSLDHDDDCDDDYDCECSTYGSARASDALSEEVQDWVAAACGGYTAGDPIWEEPEVLAGRSGFISVNAWAYALHRGLPRLLTTMRQNRDRSTRFPDDYAYYAAYVTNLEEAQRRYGDLNECHCARCYIAPDRPRCACGGAHCVECHPDGPPDWCTCRQCQPPQVDDTNYPDDFNGRPEVVAPEGRVRFGIEIEFDRDSAVSRRSDDMRRNIINVLQRQGIAAVDLGYTHEVTRCWKMTTDASVSGGELVSPIMSGSDDSIEEVREALRIVKDNGGVTGRNVGMHVHLDVSRFRTSQLKALAENMRRTERMLAAYVPDHRYDGSNGCGATLYHQDEWDTIATWVEAVDPAQHCRTRDNRVRSCPVNRYRSINFNSLLNYGTVEVRLLGHTLNTVKVRTWIRALQTIVDASSRRALVRGDGLEWLVEHGLEQEHADRFREIATSRGHADWLQIQAA